jgi:hypothetical protein
MVSMSSSLICYTLQLFVIFVCSVAARPSIWDISIDESPAPPPQDGPPLSAGAIRDKAYLPLEIGAVLGSYFLSLIVITSAILTVGRRLRRSAQTHPKGLAMEMLKPLRTIGNPSDIDMSKSPDSNAWGPSPVTPIDKKDAWPNLARKTSWGTSRKSQKKHVSVQSSVVTFDDSIVEEDKTKAELEMERLYAAVAQHEDKKEKSRSLTNDKPLAQHPPELQHLRLAAPVPQPPPIPDEPMSPSRTSSKSPMNSTSPRATRSGRPTPLSFNGTASHSRASSRTSMGSFAGRRHGSIRDLQISLPISPPMGSPEIMSDNMRYYGESEPLSPRAYTPREPPTPPYRKDSQSSRHEQSMTSPKKSHFSKHFTPSIRSSRTSANDSPSQTPRTATFPPSQTPRTATFPPSQTPRTATFPPSQTPRTAKFPTFTVTHESVESLDQQVEQVMDAPLPIPDQSGEKTPKGARKKAPLNLRITGGGESTASLPLRTAPLPFRSMGTPGFARPPSMIKATVIERKMDNRLRAPGTGVPSTPYSPFYFPQTPMTPMTPSRLVTREERRRQKKEEGRRVATIEDAVIDEEDMWGESY